MSVVKIERLVVVADLGHIGVVEDIDQFAPTATGAQLQLTVFLDPTPFPLALILPLFGITDTRFTLYVVDPGVLDTLTIGSDIFTGG